MDLDTLGLALVGLLSAAFTAVVGVGGGVFLIGAMTLFLPLAALVPVHGVAQLAANVTRTGFGLEHARWRLVVRFGLGALVGAFLAAPLVRSVPETALSLSLGAFILIAVWLPRRAVGTIPELAFAPVGALQAAISLFVGAVGPLLSPFLLHRDLNRDQIVVTHGAMMGVVHATKTAAFASNGFDFRPYLGVTAMLIVCVSAGS